MKPRNKAISASQYEMIRLRQAHLNNEIWKEAARSIGRLKARAIMRAAKSALKELKP